jgi:hypothetical protein
MTLLGFPGINEIRARTLPIESNVALIHLVAGVIYLLHGPVPYPAGPVAEGYQFSAYGIMAFAVATLVISKRGAPSARTQQRFKKFRNKILAINASRSELSSWRGGRRSVDVR